MANNTPPPGWPIGEPYEPYIPSGPSTPGTDYDQNPTKNWYPNGKYGWDDPYLNGDAQTRNERYPHYWSYGDPDPNWRPSFFGETPPWNRNPNDTTGSANTQKGQWFGNTSNKISPEQRAREKQEYEQEDAARAGAKQADRDSDAAFWAAGGKRGRLSNGRVFAVYPPGWTGPRKYDEFNFDPEKDFKSGPLRFSWDQAPAGTNTGGPPAPAPGPTAGPTAAPPPAPGPAAGPTAAPPAAPGPTPAPTTGPRPWDSEGYNKPWVDNNGTTHYEPRGSGPQQSQEEVAYWAGLAKTDPKHWLTSRAQSDNDPNWGSAKTISYVKGDNGKYRAAVNQEQPYYKSLTDEQKAWGANTANEFNKQFDPNNEVNYAERTKNAKFYQLQAMKPELRDRIMANAGQNTPAAKAMMAQWGDAISQYKAQSQPQPTPGPPQPTPGPPPPPPPTPRIVQGQPQQPGQPPPANMGDARFHNGNPYYNGKGNLRMPFRNAIASRMMNDMQSQQQPPTSWNMGGQNGQAMFGTQNQYSYWPQGGQQGYGMGAPSSNPYQQSYGPPQTMNYYGGQQGYGGGGQYGYGGPSGGGQYGEPPMPNYSQNSGYGGGQESYGGGGQQGYGGHVVTQEKLAQYAASKAQELALTPEQRATRDRENEERSRVTNGPYGLRGPGTPGYTGNVYTGPQGYGGGGQYGERPLRRDGLYEGGKFSGFQGGGQYGGPPMPSYGTGTPLGNRYQQSYGPRIATSGQVPDTSPRIEYTAEGKAAWELEYQRQVANGEINWAT